MIELIKKNILVILIILFLIIIYYLNYKEEKFNNTVIDKPNINNIWLYWDSLDSKETYPFIQLCHETVYKNCGKNFKIVLLNKDNIMKYLPELVEYKDRLDKLIIAHKVDIYRIMLLYKYGGIYIDSDTIVMKDLSDIINKLDTYDFVGFGCTGPVCKDGYGKPSNWILASRPNTLLMKKILDKQLEIIKNPIDYHDIGKLLIWEVLDDMIKNYNYKYYQYPNTVDGTRDKNGEWVTSDMVFSSEQIDYDDDNKFLFYVFYNHDMDNSIKKMSKKDLLSKNWNYTKYLKKALSI